MTKRYVIANLQVSRQFLDSRELGNSPKSLANLHNNQVTVRDGGGGDHLISKCYNHNAFVKIVCKSRLEECQ